MRIPLAELADRLGGILSPASHGTIDVSGFATDSRDVQPGDLFIAIRGANVDGHDYIAKARNLGAVACLVEREVEGPHILVYEVVGALARMALSFRRDFEGPVVGITGSAGKSSAKEFVAAALSPLGRVMKTEGNRNTEYTAPLMWAELPLSASGSSRGEGVGVWAESGQPAAVVVEMGMRGLGQIRHLASFSKPSIALITNIGVAHLSELGSRDNIARAKSEIFESLKADSTAIFWAEDDYAGFLRDQAREAKVRTFGESESADARLVSYRALDWDRSELHIVYAGATYRAEIPVVGKHQALNATAAFLVAVVAGVDPAEAASALASTKLPENRMAIRREGDLTYVLDMYNSAPPAVLAALRTIREVIRESLETRIVAVLGEMRELGELTESGHRDVGRALVEHGVSEAILLNAGASGPVHFIAEAAIEAGLPAANIRVASSHEEVRQFLLELRGPRVVLVKGSRGVELERALPF